MFFKIFQRLILFQSINFETNIIIYLYGTMSCSDYQSKYLPRHSFLADPHQRTISSSGQDFPFLLGCRITFRLRVCSPIPHDLLHLLHGPHSPTLQFFGPSEI